jgi:signal peptidase II
VFIISKLFIKWEFVVLLLGLITALIVLGLDQSSKYFMLFNVLEKDTILPIAPFFNLVRAWNTGVSFSMFDSWGMAGVIILSVVAIAVILYLLWWLSSEKNKTIQVSIGFIIGGALGNVIDRIRFGAVFDFLDFYVGVKHWPAFNVADTFICIGAVMIIAYSFLSKKEKAGE